MLAVPAALLGVAIPTRLMQAAFIGIALFALLLAAGATLLASDRAVFAVARAVDPHRDEAAQEPPAAC